MPRKSTSAGPFSKSPYSEGSSQDAPTEPTFNTQVPKERYTHFSTQYFGESLKINWEVLQEVDLEGEMQHLHGAGA